MGLDLFSDAILTGPDRWQAERAVIRGHYLRSVPSGKTHVFQHGDAIVMFSVPANPYISRFLFGADDWSVWELSRLWAPDGHAPNLLTQAISRGVSGLRRLEDVDAVISYADPAQGHTGGVYRAASWTFHGVGEESRAYVMPDGRTIARRAFHSGSKGMTKDEIEATGAAEVKMAGKLRFVRPLTKRAKRHLAQKSPRPKPRA